MVEPLTAVADVLGTADMVTVVGVSEIVVVVLTSRGVETDVVAPLIVVVGVFDSVKVITGDVIEGVSDVVGTDTGMVFSEIVIPELPPVGIETDMVVSSIVVR